MSKNITPFWVEGMNDENRHERISDLFALIKQKLTAESGSHEALKVETYVFVVDPPPLKLELIAQDVDADNFFWGTAGQAIVTEDKGVAMALAPAVFDLWSESLYVVVFNAHSPGKAILGKWVSEVLESEVASDSSTGIKLPGYAVLTFDWGDLVQ